MTISLAVCQKIENQKYHIILIFHFWIHIQNTSSIYPTMEIFTHFYSLLLYLQ